MLAWVRTFSPGFGVGDIRRGLESGIKMEPLKLYSVSMHF